jgi:hypothetical protein
MVDLVVVFWFWFCFIHDGRLLNYVRVFDATPA